MMNFQNGAALATEDGIKVDYVKVADDIAVKTAYTLSVVVVLPVQSSCIRLPVLLPLKGMN